MSVNDRSRGRKAKKQRRNTVDGRRDGRNIGKKLKTVIRTVVMAAGILCLSRFINTERHEGQSLCKVLRPATDAPLRMDGAISQNQ
jgi:hypothetical protein